jgi:hypothetical protein
MTLPLPCFLEVLILNDFKSFVLEVLIAKDFKSFISEVLILVDLKSLRMSEMREVEKFSEVLILEELRREKCEIKGFLRGVSGRGSIGSATREGAGKARASGGRGEDSRSIFMRDHSILINLVSI